MKSLLSIFVIAVCVGAYFVYIKPLSYEVRVLNAQKAEYVNILNTVQEIKQKRDAVLLDYNSLSPDEIDRLNKIIPDKLNSVTYLNNVSSLATKNGIQINDYKVSDDNNGMVDVANPNAPTNSFKTTKVFMKLSGSYPQFLSFLNEMESALSLTDVVTLKIDSAASTPGGSKVIGPALFLTYTLEAKVYSLK